MTEVESGRATAVYTVNEFCRRYAISRGFFYKEVRAGRLKARKAGRRTVILPEDAAAWADSLPEMEQV